MTAGSPAHDVESPARRAFVAGLAEAFAEAKVEYVILHGGTGEGGDSDIDLAVTPESLPILNDLVRRGCFGRLLQRLHYDVPWCFYYVVEADEPDRRYRQLDVACDPWGIGRYGPAVSVSLGRTTAIDEVQVPAPAAETVYLAIKRARKGIRGPADRSALNRAVAANADHVAAILGEVYGKRTATLVDDLRDDATRLTNALAQLERLRRRRALRPVLLVRRLGYSVPRILKRVLDPTGLVVALVGADNARRSELASRLVAASPGLFRRADRPQRWGELSIAYLKRRSSLVILERASLDPPRRPRPDLTFLLDIDEPPSDELDRALGHIEDVLAARLV